MKLSYYFGDKPFWHDTTRLALPFVWVFILAYLTEDIPKAVLCLQRFFSKKWLKPVTPEGIRGLEEWKLQQAKKKNAVEVVL